MRQVIQDVRQGHVRVEEIPPPALKPAGVLVRTVASVVSVGTERLALEFGQKSLLGKALERPDLVRQVVDKTKRDGVISAYQAVKGRLGVPLSLGYSSAGIVEGVGDGVEGVQVGDRVACAGAGYANHAEVVWIPKNLCVKIPAGPVFDEAPFATVGAIALQGVRLVGPTLGESVVVIGLGLIGQIALQCLKANGCRVFGIDHEADRVTLAIEFGADEAVVSDMPSIVDRVNHFTRGRGADAVIVTAATESDEPVRVAGEICRQRGRVIIVGAVGMNIPRRPYYERELTVKVSMSYGPGRYDPVYEEKGIDYPIGYVRWTEQRNMEAFLDLLAERKVNVQGLITHRFSIADAEEAYKLLSGHRKEKYLGILLTYPEKLEEKRKVSLIQTLPAVTSNQVKLGLIGAGSFARSTLLPILKRLPSVTLTAIATSNGVSSKSTGAQYGFQYCTTDYREILNDKEINSVLIATRHGLHAPLVIDALKSGKHVFVEKPLCIREGDLEKIARTYAQYSGNKANLEAANQEAKDFIPSGGTHDQALAKPPLLMVGFNRRFAPLTQKAREFLRDRIGPLVVNYRVNAGSLPLGHWANDPEEGGGRIIGEVCHFVDFISYLVGQHPVKIFTQGAPLDSVSVTLKYEDGSLGNIQYITSGPQTYSKERVEIFGKGKVFTIDDFKRAEWVSDKNSGRVRHWLKQDKGHKGELESFVKAVLEGRASPIDPNDAIQTTHVMFQILESLSCMRR